MKPAKLVPIQQQWKVSDPLGIEVDLTHTAGSAPNAPMLTEMTNVIQRPEFIICMPDGMRCYFLAQTWKRNLMVQAIVCEMGFCVASMMVNPPAAYVSELLMKGSLIPLV